jgi:hypothetical protein
LALPPPLLAPYDQNGARGKSFMFMNVHFWTEFLSKSDGREVTPSTAKQEVRTVVAEYRLYFLDQARNILGPVSQRAH